MARITDRAKIIREWISSTGFFATFAWLAYRMRKALGLHYPSMMRIKTRLADFPLVARTGHSSDLTAFHQIFGFNEYACLRNIRSPRLILDLGANVGYSSAYFLSCFPTARVVAVEPSPDNFRLCCANLTGYGSRARVVLGAAWSSRRNLVLSPGTFGDGLEWATQVLEDDGSGAEPRVEGWDIPSLLELSGGGEIDILKIDIERSELSVFGDNSSIWLPRVRTICIELHGADCAEVFFNALRHFDYDVESSGELTICRNLRPKAS